MVPSLFILFLYVLMPGKYVTIKGDTLQRRVVYIMISRKHLNLLEYNGRDYLHGIYLFVKHFKKYFSEKVTYKRGFAHRQCIN